MPPIDDDTPDAAPQSFGSPPTVQTSVATPIGAWQPQRMVAAAAATMGAMLVPAFVLLAILGELLSYTPVPTQDMWDAYLAFYAGISRGDYGWWWAQHNEHRLVFSKVLFWIDISQFKGTLVFLNVMNYVLAGLLLLLFLIVLSRALPPKADRRLLFIAGACICAFVFSWSQSENLVWALQSAYWAAMLFPLLAFYLLYVSTRKAKRSIFYFSGACCFGVVSVGTLAAGVLVLPLMTIVAGLVRLDWRKVVVLGLLSVGTCYLYFADYTSPRAGKLSPLHLVLTRPSELVSYVMVYLGTPFYVMTGERAPLILTLLAGVLFLAGVAFFASKAVSNPERCTVQLMVLVAFCGYIIVSGALTASGRLDVGVESAETISRYRTPPFMAWAALLILCLSYFYRELISRPYLLSGLISLPLLLLPVQLQARRANKYGDFELVVAALALEMGVHDRSQIQTNLYPRMEQVFAAAQDAREHNWSIFGNDAIRDVEKTLGTSPPRESMPACLGAVESRMAIADELRFVKVEGWVYAPQENRVPEGVSILDGTGRVVGHAVAGKYRPDFGTQTRGHLHAGFEGYVLTESGNAPLLLMASGPGCELVVSPP